MEYKIKVKPEDFRVKEIVLLLLKDKGEYSIYLLKKNGWNTVDVLKRIAKKAEIPFSHISYGGKKDRHALTEQFISIKKLYKKSTIEEKNYSLKFIGFTDEPIVPQNILGNEFNIIVRAIPKKAQDSILESLKKIKEYGYINYFDDQRFGSFDPKQGFIGEKIIKDHYNGAIKIYFTHIYPEDKKEAKERKKYLFKQWGKWQECLNAATTKIEKFIFSWLTRNTKDLLTILKKIPHEEMSIFFSVYQSFLLNETVRRLLLSMFDLDNLLTHRGIAGDYLFFNEIDIKKWQDLKDLSIPTASSKAKMPDTVTEKIYTELLTERGIKPSMFNLRKIRQAFFKSFERDVLIMPERFNYQIEDDEIYEGRIKLNLQFILQRGSYATMLVTC